MEEFLGKLKTLWEQKKIVEEISSTLDEEKSKLEGHKTEIQKMMEAMGLEKQPLPGYGTVYRQKSFSVKIPKDPAAKDKLFGWIREHKGDDVLKNMVSINSQTLNSFYKAELEVAKEKGDIDWALPGIEAPEVYYTLNMRK